MSALRAALAGLLLLLGPAAGAELWVGNVSIDSVSQATAPQEDLSFDLQLRALHDEIDPGTNEEFVAAETVLVGARSTWEYDASGNDSNAVIIANPADPALDWRLPQHPSLPGSGSAEFGFGDAGDDQGGVGTLLASNPRTLDGGALQRTAPVYLRRSFDVTLADFPNGLADIDRLVPALQADDGAIVYLNGQEIFRLNMPPRPAGLAPGEVEPSHSLRPTRSVQGSAESGFLEQPEAATTADQRAAQQAFVQQLVVGTNWIAVELHQREFALPDPGSVDPTAVGRPFSFRLIVHVDGSGQARLLKDVIQMRDPGTLEPVLLTREELIPAFSPARLVDGRPVGLRVSSVAYDFDCTLPDAATRYSAGCDADRNAIGLTPVGPGPFGREPTVLELTLKDPFDAPTNPFQHRYHPDHDNLDAQFGATQVEALDVTRTVTLTFSDANPALRTLVNPDLHQSPDWGSDVVGGTYEETLVGLHATDIRVKGTFVLRRAALGDELNPDPS